ncbi:LysR substrate-binding domain-containing protein [Novosphingobium sp. 1949]|uniref:LysR substrate-binding domain-containing protein n=1 Tax=Novosphingobium organovorum TaxID=2930092 RepID=A0ABT0BBX0_9SPHN|nr:LysR family transcriptional regulator [Novosphingobium organovorum]MCJ2182537.1 LysR substrate-binding domain-containing protein [Novosphingobium organovorum]
MDVLAHIRTFISIADQGSLAAAAKARGSAPSAVTASLQRLEDHVGAKLILRSTRSLSLTPEGERFLARCRAVVGDLDEAIDRVADAGPLRGAIRLTSINDFGRSRLAGLIDSFQVRHPGVTFELSLGDEVLDLVEGGYDLGLRTGPLSDSRLKARLILRSGRSVCAAPAYWARHGKPTRPEELARHNCLVLSRLGNPQGTWQFRDGAQALAVQVSGSRTANDGGLLRQWAIAGAGVVLKSDYDIAADRDAGRLETALDAFRLTDVNLYAVHAAGRHPPRRVAAFIDYLAAMLFRA